MQCTFRQVAADVACLLSCTDPVQASFWHTHLVSSARWMEQLVGSQAGLEQDLDSTETESVVSSDMHRVASNLSSGTMAAEASSGQTAPSLEASVGLGEIAIYVSAHTCKDWWPEEVASLPFSDIAQSQPSLCYAKSSVISVS